MDKSVCIRSLSKKYGDFLALDRITLDVESGKVFALLGPNGAGKTTLMRILTTQLQPSNGTASVLGNDVITQSKRIKEILSYVPQEMSVWTDISGYENLLIYSKIYGIPSANRQELIANALRTMELEDFANSLVNTYSGGMIRKLELASAIMIKPKILFLDEPTIGLDPSARKTVWGKLCSLNKENNVSIFFSTHYMDEADNYSDEIGIISKGKIVKVGSPEELKKSVGDELIELDLIAPLNKTSIHKLRNLDFVTSVQASENSLKISVKDIERSLNLIIEFLIENNIMIKKIATSKHTMDDAFLKYAGAGELLANQPHLEEVKRIRKRVWSG